MSPYGGGKRVRTADPLLAGQVLYQLSYTPVMPSACPKRRGVRNKTNAPIVAEQVLLKMNKKETNRFLYRLKMD